LPEQQPFFFINNGGRIEVHQSNFVRHFEHLSPDFNAGFYIFNFYFSVELKLHYYIILQVAILKLYIPL